MGLTSRRSGAKRIVKDIEDTKGKNAQMPNSTTSHPTIAIVGLVHSHVWGHLATMLAGEQARLVGIAESIPDLIAEAKNRGAAQVPIYADYHAMLDELKPDIVWAFVENNRHLEIAQACAPRKINLIYEKPLAATYREALEIQRLAQAHDIRVMTNYQMAWWPANYVAKAQADAGRVGQVWRLRGIVGHGGPGSSGVGRYFWNWLTDPEQNGAGALMDFGCYNALWALWYLGRPDSVFAQVIHLRPETFPKVEDSSAMLLHYSKGAGLFEGSWDLPRGFQELEVFGLEGSVTMRRDGVEVRRGKEMAEQVELSPLPPERSAPIAYMAHALRTYQPIEGLTALEINVDVVEIIEAAKLSVQTGRAVSLPLASI